MSTVIEWLADSLVAGSIVMMIVMLIRGVILRKMPRRYAYLLWAVVAIRLVCPVSIESPLSVFNYVPEVKLVQKHSAQSDTITSSDMDSKSDTISNGQTSPFSEAYRADGMETKQTTAKTAQQYLIGQALYITGPSQIIRLPMAVAPSHKPWHKPTMWRGATLETKERPSGEMNSSATVSRK